MTAAVTGAIAQLEREDYLWAGGRTSGERRGKGAGGGSVQFSPCECLYPNKDIYRSCGSETIQSAARQSESIIGQRLARRLRAATSCLRSGQWVLDPDIKGFFDNLPQDLMMKAVRKHSRDPWLVLNIERWLQAPTQDEQGNLTSRNKGATQGSVISPPINQRQPGWQCPRVRSLGKG